MHSFSREVGMGSSRHCLLGDDKTRSVISSSVTGEKLVRTSSVQGGNEEKEGKSVKDQELKIRSTVTCALISCET